MFSDDDNTSFTKLNRTHQLWIKAKLVQLLKAILRDQFDLFIKTKLLDKYHKVVIDYNVRSELNPLSPSIRFQILLLCFHTFLTEVVGRSC